MKLFWVLLLFILSAAVVLGVNIYFRATLFLRMDGVADSLVLDSGEAYDILDAGDCVYVRYISPEGELLAKKKMPKTREYSFFKRSIIGALDGAVYLYEWDYNVMNYTGLDEYVLRWDIASGDVQIIYRDFAPTVSHVSSVKTDGASYLARYSGAGEYNLRKVHLKSGIVEDVGSFVPPRDITYFDVNGGIVITSPDSRMWVSQDGYDWQPYEGGVEAENDYTIAYVPLLLMWDESMMWPLAGELVGAWCLIVLRIAFKRRTPLLVKQILILAPVMAVGLALLAVLSQRSLDDTVSAQVFDRLLVSAAEKAELIDAEKFAAINWDDPFADEYYCQLRLEFQRYSEGVTREWGLSGGSAYSYTCYWLYYIKDGWAHVAACDNITIGIPVEDNEPTAKMLNADGPVAISAFDAFGAGVWLDALYPIKVNGEIVGLVDASEPLVQSTYAFSGFKLGTVVFGTVIMASELLVLMIMLGVTLGAVRKLKLGALAVANGDYKYMVHIRTNDELSDIAGAFNRMSETVGASIADISKTSDAYSRFVPRGLFSFLGRPDVLGVRLGDCADVHAALLTVRIHNFESYHKRADLFEFLNAFFSRVAPAVNDNSGFVERYSENGLTAIFSDGPAAALRAAETIVNETGGCSAVVSCESVLLGVIGCGERMSVKIVSKHMTRMDSICKVGERLGCGVIVTQSACEEAGVGTRLLGYISADGDSTALYDIFGLSEQRESKLETLDSFQRAVELYYNNDFYGARNGFIDVIKRSPHDLAAREYLLMSDSLYLSGAANAKPLMEV